MNTDKQNDGGTGDFLKDLLNQFKADDPMVRAQLNDQRLMKLAEYAVTKGLVDLKVTPEDLQNSFTEFKALVKRGSFTLKDLEDDVYNRYGIQEGNRIAPDADEKPVIGFNVHQLDVADLPTDDPKNH